MIRDIARGVANGVLAYVGKTATGYDPFLFRASMSPQEVEISDDMYLITAAVSEGYRQSLDTPLVPPPAGPLFDHRPPSFPPEGGHAGSGAEPHGLDETRPGLPPAPANTASLAWTGELPAQKWMNFYTKVLARFAANVSLRLTVSFEVAPPGGIATQTVEETRSALRELGLTGKTAQS